MKIPLPWKFGVKDQSRDIIRFSESSMVLRGQWSCIQRQLKFGLPVPRCVPRARRSSPQLAPFKLRRTLSLTRDKILLSLGQSLRFLFLPPFNLKTFGNWWPKTAPKIKKLEQKFSVQRKTWIKNPTNESSAKVRQNRHTKHWISRISPSKSLKDTTVAKNCEVKYPKTF